VVHVSWVCWMYWVCWDQGRDAYLSQSRHFEQVETSTDCWPWLARTRAQEQGSDIRSKLLNLTGFFSSWGGSVAMVGTPVGGVELISGDLIKGTGRTKAIGCFAAKEDV
jgi:hypothetical protein